MTKSDDLFEDDPHYEEFVKDYERRRKDLQEHILAFLDNEEIDEEYAIGMLLDLTIEMRMVAYAQSTERPSISGLKIDLDRFQGDVGNFVREAKKSAGDFIQAALVARAEAGLDDSSK